MKHVIVESKGLARENCELSMNTMDGCIHGCEYCYGPLVRHVPKEAFHTRSAPRLTPEDIERSAAATAGDPRPVQLCFITDPYQPAEAELGLTRKAIEILHKYGHPVSILTKGDALARRDFDLYRPGDSFGITLTFLDADKARRHEPYAAPPDVRIANVMEAKMQGIDTYISLEPVMDQNQPLVIVHATAGFTDHYKVGKRNYGGGPDGIDYKTLVRDVIDAAVVKYGRGVHIKSSLSMATYGSPDGYKIGVQLP